MPPSASDRPVTRGLAGKRVLVARARGQGEASERLLRERGALPVVIPTIAFGPPDDEAPLRQALTHLADVDWVVFTSANGVEHAFRALGALGVTGARAGALAPGTFSGTHAPPRIAVLGTATQAALEAHGRAADVIAKEFRGEGVAAALLEAMRGEGDLPKGDRAPGVAAPRVLILRAQEARDVLPDTLARAGLEVRVVAAYRTQPLPDGAAEVRRLLLRGELDVVVFASGSTVDSVCDVLAAAPSEAREPGASVDVGSAVESGAPAASAEARALARVTVACIGPVTTAAARARGVRVDVVPAVATFVDVIAALESHFRAI